MKQIVKIATPISHLFKDEEIGKKLTIISDLLEFRDHSPNWPVENQECIFHSDFNLVAPMDQNAITDFQNKVDIIKENVALVSVHVPGCYTVLKKENYGYVPCGRLMTKEEMIENACNNLSRIRIDKLQDIPFALENNNYFNTGGHEIVSEPNFLLQLMRETNLNFLFDISHAIISEINGNHKFIEFYSREYLDRTIQLHISSFSYLDKLALDAHDPPTDEIWEVVNYFLKNSSCLNYLTVEYYKSYSILVQLISHMRGKISKINNFC